MKIVVTGGSGQLGTLVLQRLVDDAAVTKVVSLDKRPPLVVSPKLESVTADVRDADIGAHFAGAHAVVHLAFIVTKKAPRDLFWGVNVEGSKNVFRAAAAARVKQILYASSVAAYGVVPGHPVPILESSPRKHQPGFPYSATKYEVEAFLDTLEKAHPEIAIVRVRPTILVGERMEHPFGAALKARRIPIAGEAPLPIVWDEDVADLFLLALHKGAHGAFNASADDPKSAAELARATGIGTLRVPREVALAFARLSPALERAGIGEAVDEAWIESNSVTMIPSCDRAKHELGWRPQAPTALDVMRKYLATVPRRLDRRLALFFKLLDLRARRGELPPEATRTDGRLYLALTGEGGGDRGLLVESGQLRVLPRAPRPPTSIVTMPAAALLELLAGKRNAPVARVARVQGDPSAATTLDGIVEAFRRERRSGGVHGVAARAMERWFAA